LNGSLLLDNSAWARLAHPSLPDARASEIANALESGQLVTSLPFLLEAGYSAINGAAHRELMDDLQALPQVRIDDETERRALEAQGQLARIGHHRIPPVDLILAALADRSELGILHYDADYELIRERTDLRFRSVWLAARGAL
jgi:predicted nucleic acid-binding protein